MSQCFWNLNTRNIPFKRKDLPQTSQKTYSSTPGVHRLPLNSWSYETSPVTGKRLPMRNYYYKKELLSFLLTKLSLGLSLKWKDTHFNSLERYCLSRVRLQVSGRSKLLTVRIPVLKCEWPLTAPTEATQKGAPRAAAPGVRQITCMGPRRGCVNMMTQAAHTLGRCDFPSLVLHFPHLPRCLRTTRKRESADRVGGSVWRYQEVGDT